MQATDQQRVEAFLSTWLGSEGNERANYQTFFGDLCRALGVDGPPPKGDAPGDPYCFDKDIKFFTSDKAESTTRYADFYKEGCFLIEAKQGSTQSGKGHGKRGTKAYRDNMQKAFNQAKSYAYNRLLGELPPFLITCDIGSHFELWEGFSGEYGSYGARQRIALEDLRQEDVFDRFVKIFTDPQALNPEKYRARVTREVAAELAKLSRWLEENGPSPLTPLPEGVREASPEEMGNPTELPSPPGRRAGDEGTHPEAVAQFLMRCIFTMFAEDVELLKGEVFTTMLRDRWIPNPALFKPEIEQLWQTMNTGGQLFGQGRILQFNGSFFENATAFELPLDQLKVLYAAAEKDWSNVEPAIFGTLLERALEKKERSRLGAHYTPRSYVERLVRPVVMEPLRQEWDDIELELKRILQPEPGQEEPKPSQQKKAEDEIRAFLAKLRSIKILDPACGTGNFLYVSLDLLKGLEQEVIIRLVDVAGNVQLGLEQINPSQFLGIEINPRATTIAELVIWIGYLQWYFKRYGNAEPPEPVLQAFHNIECQDAVLAYDGKEPDVDPATGEVRTRWGGRMMKHPVTGEDVPDPSDQKVIYRYLNPRPAEWPEADYVVSNPPFVGNKRMRTFLGDGYSETLREIYPEVPETVDYVMYWWHRAADLAYLSQINSFGFITTNSIRQSWQRTLIDSHLSNKSPIQLFFAIPDHPWVEDGAAVRIAMTAAEGTKDSSGKRVNKIGVLIQEIDAETPEESAEKIRLKWKEVGKMSGSLKPSLDFSQLQSLKSNANLFSRGVMLFGSGFIVDRNDFSKIESDVLFKYRGGRDFMQSPRDIKVIDLFELSINEVKTKYPNAYQWLLERVKPQRDTNRNRNLRENWWLFGRPRSEIRPALLDLNRYIATAATSKHRVFAFLDGDVLPDDSIIVIALSDAYFLGILSSKIHVLWTLSAGGTLEDRPRYNQSVCLAPFVFPDPNPELKQKIRDLGERLDAHRKKVQADHPDITITGMYNLLEKLRAGEPFTDEDREYNNRALVSTLKQIHDELDAAVLDAYGWPHDITDEQILENLVALNAQRAEEERNGLIRWLRPEYQAPDEVQPEQTTLEVVAQEEPVIEPVEQQRWPTKPREQLTAIRDLLRTTSGEWTAKQLAAQFKGFSAARATTKQNRISAITENLDRLEWFGLVISEQREGITYWEFAEGVKAA